MILTKGELELLVEVNASILPVPDRGNPVLIVLFVQFIVLPVKFVPVKLIAEITAPAQTSWDTIGDNVGAGLITN
jgi:hypothetical protein